MNNCVFTGRLTREPDVKYTTGEKATAICRFTIAVDRKFKREGEPTADFLNMVAFGKHAENIGKYFHKGKPIVIEKSHVQTGSYTNKEGIKVYTTDFMVDEWGFVEKDSDNTTGSAPQTTRQAPVARQYEEEGDLPF